MDRILRPLSEAEQSALFDGLEVGAKLLDKQRPLDVSDIQELYDFFLNSGNESPEEIIALGLNFGQLFIDANDYEWIRVHDEYGEETCVAPKNITINCAPISMIQKRLNAKENVDISELYGETVKTIQNLIDSNEYEYR